MNLMKAIFFVIFFASSAWEVFLLLINMHYSTSEKARIPDIFRDIVSENDFEKSKNYLDDKTKFLVAKIMFETLITFFALLYFFPAFERVAINFSLRVVHTNGIYQSLMFFLLVGLLYFAIDLPFSIYSTFVLERKYGFNRTNASAFVKDNFKSLFIGLIFGGLIIFILYVIVMRINLWWIPVSIALVLISLVLEWAYPILIIPLFYKLKPLKNERLRTKINDVANRVDFKTSGIYVMNASVRSTHTNAFFAGLGNSKRIVLYDTLLENHAEDGIIAVIAHEAGHYHYKHILKLFLYSSIVLTATVFFTFILNRSSIFVNMFNLCELCIDLPFVYAFVLLSSLASFFEFISNSLSRSFEFQADQFAVSLTSKESMINALKKLVKVNLSNLNPHPLYALFKYSHPAPCERISAILNLPQDKVF